MPDPMRTPKIAEAITDHIEKPILEGDVKAGGKTRRRARTGRETRRFAAVVARSLG